VDEAFFFIQRTSLAKLVCNIRQQPPQKLIAAPSLKPPMYRFVVGIALRQHMPLRTCLRSHRTASRTRRVGIGLRPGRPFCWYLDKRFMAENECRSQEFPRYRKSVLSGDGTRSD
jgi:hypothetical protein